VLRIFLTLKNPSPWPSANPQTLGPVASTLTTTPLRRLFKDLYFVISFAHLTDLFEIPKWLNISLQGTDMTNMEAEKMPNPFS
jgi:hypothetical protein